MMILIALTACSSPSQNNSSSPPAPASTEPAAALPTPSVNPTLKPLNGRTTGEIVAAIGQCLTAQGWDVTVGLDVIYYNGPQEQYSQYHKASAGCSQSTGANDIAPPSYTPEFLSTKYAEETKTHSCLANASYPVPKMPSLQKYSDDILTKGLIYSSYTGLNLSDSQHASLYKKCGDPLQSWG